VPLPQGLTQQPRPGWDPEDGFIKLDVVVTDSSGKPVPGLALKDFTLLEASKPHTILSSHAFDGILSKADPPVQVILFIDTIKLTFAQAASAQQGVKKFLLQDGGHLALPVSVFWLSSDALWATPQARPTREGRVLAADIDHKNRLRVIWRNPDYNDPLTSLKALGLIAALEKREPGRKLLVSIGTGDQGPGLVGRPGNPLAFDPIVWYSILLREARIALYSLSPAGSDMLPPTDQDELQGVTSVEQATFSKLDRKVLAVQSGGQVMEQSNDLTGQIDRVVEDAGAFYTLGFDPRPADHVDEYHDLRVLVGKPGLTGRTNTGYYDQPYYRDQSNLAARGVTVDQLKQMLEAAQGNSDAEVARLLSGLELKERLSDTTFSSLEAGLRSARPREALVAVSAASAFRDPPAAQIPTIAPPDLSEQRLMLSRTIDYLNKTIARLPNFFATRTTVRYEESPPKYERAGVAGTGYQPLHVVSNSVETVLYRNGREVTDAGAQKGKGAKTEDRQLSVHGTFGPILDTVISDAMVTGFTWSHWEQGANGRLAILRYVVAAEKSHYEIADCCLPDGDGTGAYRIRTGYHGEIAIDPTSGAVLRLKVQADLKPTLPLVRADIMVEYGPVDIGGKSYICPLKAVYISRGRTVRVMPQWQASFTTSGPSITKLNDVSFGEYHMFRADSRVLPGFNPAPAEKSPAPDSPHPPETAPPPQ
jgi:VWFA-related protein